MTDLTTTYLGLNLPHPVVASAGPLAQNVDGARELAAGGVSAIVLHSLYEEVLRREAARDTELVDLYSEVDAESNSFFPSAAVRDESVSARYLSLVERCVEAVDVPIIASLNGSSLGSWVEFAKQIQDAGAAALELNVYFVPGDVRVSSRAVEDLHLDILRSVKQAVQIPVAMKLSPFFSAFGHFALELDEAGADGLVLFNRFMQPDIDLEQTAVVPSLQLSTPAEGKVPRTWIGALRGRVQASLAATTGVETSDDVVKYLLAGADVVMTTSSLVRHGAAYAGDLVQGLVKWLRSRGYSSVAEMQGLLAVPADHDSDAYQRAGYVAVLDRARQTYGNLSH